MLNLSSGKYRQGTFTEVLYFEVLVLHLAISIFCSFMLTPLHFSGKYVIVYSTNLHFVITLVISYVADSH